MDFIDRVDLELKKKKLKGTTMMRDLGFSSGLYSQWKKTRRLPNTDKIKAVASYLGVSPTYLIGEELDDSLQPATDEQIAYAFWGGAEGITSEMLNEVRQYAQMVKMREDAKNKK